jgi:NhaP-type Na+/H+ or K+/H+ antiporter
MQGQSKLEQCQLPTPIAQDSWNDCLFEQNASYFWRMLQISSNAFHSIGNGSLFIQILCVLLIRPASAFICYPGQAPISSMMPKVESDFFAWLQYLQAAALSKVSRRCFQSNIMGHL